MAKARHSGGCRTKYHRTTSACPALPEKGAAGTTGNDQHREVELSTDPLTPSRVLADLLRIVGAGSVAAAFFLFGLDGAGKFGLVLLALLAPRVAGRIPGPFDLAYCATVLLATWSATGGWYRAIPWIDWPVHGVTTGTIAAMIYLMLARFDTFPGLRDRPLRGHPSAVVLLTVSLGFAAGASWELYEWFANNLLGASMNVSYVDTIADLFMDACGSLLAGLGLVVWRALYGGARGGVEHAQPC